MTAPELVARLRRARSAAAAYSGRRPELDDAAVMTVVAPGNEGPLGEDPAPLWRALRHEMAPLLDSVVAEGFREPILIGDDGRLWDGHHRLAVALAFGISVPVEFVGKEARR
jgi:hypothetical protein